MAMRLMVIIAALLLTPWKASAGECLAGLRQEVLKIIKARYPAAELTIDASGCGATFSQNLREFTVYRLNKTGDWQAPTASVGPDRGGLLVQFRVAPGEWQGALTTPFIGTEDLWVFRETHIVRNSVDRSRHIAALILTPRVDAPKGIENELIELFTDFDAHEGKGSSRAREDAPTEP